ncbi:hypothetical protein BDV93DRAFT_213386 [Ceratobasidium sp. AG-I]|nr:hypothetical protein BDV93DRAFT_213386 [Ceratobasidium sp. AG-I]
MGQNASQSAQDASKPDISGPMPLGNGGPSPPRQQRSTSGDTNRLRRERRRSRDQAASAPISPSADSPSRNAAPAPIQTIPETQPAPFALSNTRRDSTATTATAPPPYTSEPIGLDVQLEEAPPPPVPPRDYRRSNVHRRSSGARIEKSGLIGVPEHPGAHRRTQSHSHSAGPSNARPGSGGEAGTSHGGGSGARRPMPPLIASPAGSIDGMGVGGFRIEMGDSPNEMGVSAERGMSRDQGGSVDRRTRTRPRKSGDTVLSQSPPTRRGSREDPLEMLRWVSLRRSSDIS